jgi:hypothetical protein
MPSHKSVLVLNQLLMRGRGCGRGRRDIQLVDEQQKETRHNDGLVE